MDFYKHKPHLPSGYDFGSPDFREDVQALRTSEGEWSLPSRLYRPSNHPEVPPTTWLGDAEFSYDLLREVAYNLERLEVVVKKSFREDGSGSTVVSYEAYFEEV
jgi:hypothetical protein